MTDWSVFVDGSSRRAAFVKASPRKAPEPALRKTARMAATTAALPSGVGWKSVVQEGRPASGASIRRRVISRVAMPASPSIRRC